MADTKRAPGWRDVTWSWYLEVLAIYYLANFALLAIAHFALGITEQGAFFTGAGLMLLGGFLVIVDASIAVHELRVHTHRFEWTSIWNATTVGANIGVCACGERVEEITGAGLQQIGWWIQRGFSEREARRRVLAGDYPFTGVPG